MMLKTYIHTLDCKNNNEKPNLFICKLSTTTKMTVDNKASIAYYDTHTDG